MKKLFAILLLTIHLFNLAGYTLLFQYLINKADSQLVQQLDSDSYNNTDLVEVKVPLNMPYINDTKGFERVDGQLEYNGIHYNYVKRKISGDTLYVLCLANLSKTHLYNAKADYSKEINDISTSKKNTEPVKKPICTDEYSAVTNQYIINKSALAATANYLSIAFRLPDHYTAVPEQPPKIIG